VHPGHCGRGISHAPLAGAVEYARSQSVPAVYPVDNQGEKVDTTMAYVGARELFEHAGITKAADTQARLEGRNRTRNRSAPRTLARWRPKAGHDDPGG
jgi:hypothetical protein